MSLNQVSSNVKLPEEFNVVIEIPMHGEPVKYEVDKDSGALCVDRFMATAMYYPANYGYVPHTLSDDGDPVDVLVVTPVPLISGSVITCRPIGMLKMADESGLDAKVLAVPVSKLTKMYENVNTYEDLPTPLLRSIEHFFKHYKDLEDGKWVEIKGWASLDAAVEEIESSVQRYKG